MVTIAKTSIGITANAAGLSSGLKKAGDDLAKFKQQAQSSLSLTSIGSGLMSGAGSLAAFGAAAAAALPVVGGLAGAAGIVALVASELDAIDKTGKLADTLGIATESLQVLQYAGEKAGVGTTVLTSTISKLQRSLGNVGVKGSFLDLGDDLEDGALAIVGGGDRITKALADIGLEARKLADIPVDQAFREIMPALAAIEDPARRAKLGFDILGKSFTQLMPLMRDGVDGLADAEQKLRAHGRLFSDIDAKKVMAANDAITDLQSAVKGVGTQLAITLAPGIQHVAERLTELAVSIRPAFEGAGRLAAAVFAESIGSMDSSLENFAGNLNDLMPTIDEVIAKTLDFAEGFAKGAITAGEEITKFGGRLGENVIVPLLDATANMADLVAQAKQAAGFAAIATGNTSFGVGIMNSAGADKLIAANLRAASSAVETSAKLQLGIDLTPAKDAVGQFFDGIKARMEQDKLLSGIPSELKPSGSSALEAAKKAREALEVSIGKTNLKLMESVSVFGMSSNEIERWKLVQQGANDEMLRQVDALQGTMDLMTKLSTLDPGKGNLFGQLMDQLDLLDLGLQTGALSIEAYENTVMQLQKNFQAGLAGQADDLAKSLPAIEVRSPEGALRGSREAAQANIRRFAEARGKTSAEERQRKAAEDTAKNTRIANDRLKEIRDGIEEQKAVVMGI